jgi:hypothetical protein
MMRAKTWNGIKTRFMTVMVGLLLISCAAQPWPSHADGRVRVIVLGEDGSAAQIQRHESAFQRVMHELQDAMARRGFDVVDEDMLAAEFDWDANSWREKKELMQVAQLANTSDKAKNRVRAVAAFSIEVYRTKLSFARKYTILVRGQIYDAQSNQFLGSFELPRETVSGPRNCSDSGCINTIVGDRARDIATGIGSVLARRLAHLSGTDRDGGRSGDGGLENHFTVTMRHLDASESLQVISVMAEEFPGYSSLDLIRRAGDIRRYAYVTTASAVKLERWMHMLLLDMDLEPGNEVELIMRDDEIIVERVIPTTKKRSKRKPKYE